MIIFCYFETKSTIVVICIQLHKPCVHLQQNQKYGIQVKYVFWYLFLIIDRNVKL